ncbi:hypothetical protein [[Eubacterium] cellulosolvens]
MGEHTNHRRYTKYRERLRNERLKLSEEAEIYKENLKGRLPSRYPVEILSMVPRERRYKFYGGLILAIIMIFIMYGYLSMKQYSTYTSSYYNDPIITNLFLVFAFILLVIFIYVSLRSKWWMDEEGISFYWNLGDGFIPYMNIKSAIVKSDDYDDRSMNHLHIREPSLYKMPLFLVVIIRLKKRQYFFGSFRPISEIWLKVPEPEYLANLINYHRLKEFLR